MQKIVNDGLSKTLVRSLPYGTVWVNKPSPFVLGFTMPHKPRFHAFGPIVLRVPTIYEYGV